MSKGFITGFSWQDYGWFALLNSSLLVSFVSEPECKTGFLEISDLNSKKCPYS